MILPKYMREFVKYKFYLSSVGQAWHTVNAGRGIIPFNTEALKRQGKFSFGDVQSPIDYK